jgi:hypothetical protein
VPQRVGARGSQPGGRFKRHPEEVGRGELVKRGFPQALAFGDEVAAAAQPPLVERKRRRTRGRRGVCGGRIDWRRARARATRRPGTQVE